MVSIGWTHICHGTGKGGPVLFVCLFLRSESWALKKFHEIGDMHQPPPSHKCLWTVP